MSFNNGKKKTRNKEIVRVKYVYVYLYFIPLCCDVKLDIDPPQNQWLQDYRVHRIAWDDR